MKWKNKMPKNLMPKNESMAMEQYHNLVRTLTE